MNKDAISEQIIKIYSAVKKLNELFPHKVFKPDGNMVSNIGEMLTYYHYGIRLNSNSVHPPHDDSVFVKGRERKVQI
jgi:hypothetical protein